MLTYAGKGYSAAFTARFDQIADRLSAAETIEIVSGPDDICASRLTEADHHCFNASIEERDRSAAEDVGAMLGRTIQTGARFRLGAGILTAMREHFARGEMRRACGGCEWSALCTGLAAEGYPGTRVTNPG